MVIIISYNALSENMTINYENKDVVFIVIFIYLQSRFRPLSHYSMKLWRADM